MNFDTIHWEKLYDRSTDHKWCNIPWVTNFQNSRNFWFYSFAQQWSLYHQEKSDVIKNLFFYFERIHNENGEYNWKVSWLWLFKAEVRVKWGNFDPPAQKRISKSPPRIGCQITLLQSFFWRPKDLNKSISENHSNTDI